MTNKIVKVIIIGVVAVLSGCGGSLGDVCNTDDDCSSGYSCVKCSGQNACYFDDSLNKSSDFEWACTTYGIGTPTDPRYNGTTGGGTGGGTDTGSGGSYNWVYSCPGGFGGGGTVPIPRGACETQYKNYAQVYGCNDFAKFQSACISLYGCLGNDPRSLCP